MLYACAGWICVFLLWFWTRGFWIGVCCCNLLYYSAIGSTVLSVAAGLVRSMRIFLSRRSLYICWSWRSRKCDLWARGRACSVEFVCAFFIHKMGLAGARQYLRRRHSLSTWDSSSATAAAGTVASCCWWRCWDLRIEFNSHISELKLYKTSELDRTA